VETGIFKSASSILTTYDSATPRVTAEALRDLWKQADKVSTAGIAAEQRELQETAGVAIPALREIGDAVVAAAGKRVGDFLPLARTLWDEFGREGRVVGAILLGALGEANPDTVLPLLREAARTSVTWEDSDRLAMDALGPVVNLKPAAGVASLEPWLVDENRWVRRCAVTALGRVPMKHAEMTRRCLDLSERLLRDQEAEVRKAVSYAIRMSARGEVAAVVGFLARHVPPTGPSGTWILCDVIRSMSRESLPSFAGMLTRYERWAKDASLSAQDRASVESAVEVLKGAARKRGRA